MLTQQAHRVLHRLGVDVVRHPPADALRRARLLAAHDVDLVLDIGAAVGAYGLSLRRCGYHGDIISCEPRLVPFATLDDVTATDPFWTACRVAVGDQEGTATLNVAGNGDSSSVLPMLDRHASAAPASAYVGTERVTMTTVAALLSDQAARHVFVKIDVQGFEREVLAGAKPVMDRIVGLQQEMSLRPLYDGQMLFDEALDRMRDLGFTLQGVEPGFTDPTSGEMYQVDGLFFPY